jgi:hypothetical protein
MAQHPAGTASGFQGSIGNLPLVDLLQVWSLNQFNGLVTVTSGGRTGHLYFVQGEIVHAEAPGAVGEDAVRVLLAWRDGSFEPIPNTTTLARTITKRLSHLLLDAHRVLDEARRDAEPQPMALTPAPGAMRAAQPGREPSAPSALDRIRAIPGVTGLVRFGADGRPAGTATHEAEALAAKGLYLALTHGAALAQAFGLRDLSIASLQGAKESFILVQSRGSYLAVGVAHGEAVEPVAAQVRALLTRQAPR